MSPAQSTNMEEGRRRLPSRKRSRYAEHTEPEPGLPVSPIEIAEAPLTVTLELIRELVSNGSLAPHFQRLHGQRGAGWRRRPRWRSFQTTVSVGRQSTTSNPRSSVGRSSSHWNPTWTRTHRLRFTETSTKAVCRSCLRRPKLRLPRSFGCPVLLRNGGGRSTGSTTSNTQLPVWASGFDQCLESWAPVTVMHMPGYQHTGGVDRRRRARPCRPWDCPWSARAWFTGGSIHKRPGSHTTARCCLSMVTHAGLRYFLMRRVTHTLGGQPTEVDNWKVDRDPVPAERGRGQKYTLPVVCPGRAPPRRSATIRGGPVTPSRSRGSRTTTRRLPRWAQTSSQSCVADI